MDKYSHRINTDPAFSFRIKAIYRTLRVLAPDGDEWDLRAKAYGLACILEESHV
jgi:hypothetical protein